MKLRPSRFRLSILSCLALLCVPSLHAVNHNPASQASSDKKTTDVSITDATATVDEEGEITVVVTVDGGINPGLLGETNPPAQVKVAKEGDDTSLVTGDVTAAGTVTLTLDATNCDCKLDIKIIGLTDPSGSATETAPTTVTVTPAESTGSGGASISGGGAESSGGEAVASGGGGGGGGRKDEPMKQNGTEGAGGIRVDSPLGAGLPTDAGSYSGGAGALQLDGNRPSSELFTPAGLKLIGKDSLSEPIYAPQDGGGNVAPPYRQVVGQNQITDIITTGSDSYEIRVYDITAKGQRPLGSGSDVPYPIDSDNGKRLLRVTKIENPGKVVTSATFDPALYDEARYDRNLNYALPVQDNNYAVQLYFNEPFYLAGESPFDVAVEGTIVLPQYDIFTAAGGQNIGKVEQLSTTVSDGTLSLAFNAVIPPTPESLNKMPLGHVSAIKVTSAGGSVAPSTPDASLYTTSRLGEFTWQTSLPNGDYTVALYFAESVHTSGGKRVFDVQANGQTVLADYDIFASAGGSLIARQETFPVQVIDGQMTLQFVKISGDPRLCALTVTDVLTTTVVAAVNAGGSAYTSANNVSFSADSGFTGGVADSPGRLVLAIKAGSTHTADDGTIFHSDKAYAAAKQVNGHVVDGSLTRLKVTETEAGRPPKVSEFEWKTDPATGAFKSISLGDTLRKESRKVVWSLDRQSYLEITEVTDGVGVVAERITITYEKFSFGFAKVKQVRGGSGQNALVTTWDYYDRINPGDPKPAGYGLLKSRTEPSGYWEIYTYSESGALLKTTSQYLDSSFGDTVNCKEQTILRATSNPVETHITFIQGQEVSRTYRAEFPGTDEFERRSITCVTPGAAWTATDNLVSATRTYKSNHSDPAKRGKTKWTRRPDGSMTVYDYALDGSTKIVTTNTGAPNAAFPAVDTPATATFSITDGTRTVVATNVAGQTVAEDTIDIASGLILSTWDVVTVDALGRPTLISYGDGTSRSMTYVGSSASCGTCSSSGNSLLASETDRNGIVTSYAYDALNRRTEITRLGITRKTIYDPLGRELEVHRIATGGSDIRLSKTVYDLPGRVSSTEDALGNVTDYAYTYPVGGGRVTTITYPAATSGAPRGTRIETTYADGRIHEISGTAVSPVKYAYGTWTASGQAGEWTQEIKVGDANSKTEWTKTYIDFARRTVKQEYPTLTGTVAATMFYNLKGQLEKQIDADGVRTLFAYNAEGRRDVTAIDLNQYDVIDTAGTDRITKTVRDVYSKSGTVVTRMTTQVWATDNSNTATTVSVSEQDGYGNQSWQTDSAGAVTSTTTTRTGAEAWTITTTAADGTETEQTYEDGRLVSTTRYTYTDFSLPATRYPLLATSYTYDPHGRVQTQTDARTGAIDYTYTVRDEVKTVTANNGTELTTNVYDALGNLLTITRPDLSVTTNEYHLRNNQLKKVSGSQTYPVEYTYDLQGRMKTLTTWQNATTSTGAAVTSWNYDSRRGWLTAKVYPQVSGISSQVSYSYTGAGRLLTRTWARTVSGAPLVTTYGYNNAGDLNSTDYSDTTPGVAITYTRFGAQHTVTDVTGEREFEYDPSSLRPLTETLPEFYGDRILTRSYQVAASTSEPTSVPGRNNGFTLGIAGDLDSDYAVTYGYDTAGRLSTVTDPNGSFTYGYLANSSLRETVTGPVHVATTTYEPYRNVIDTVENKVGATTVSKFDYAVNNLGQRTQRANSGTAFGTASTDVFTYNAKGEVTGSTNATLSARDQSYTYDDIGNRVGSQLAGASTSYTANALNQYTQVSGLSSQPLYDADGNQKDTGSGQLYTWDAENRLLAIEPVVPSSGDKKQLNTYDAQSRRVRKQVFTYTSGTWSPTTDEKFIYDGWNVVAKYDAQVSGLSLQVSYTWGMDLSGSLQGAGGVGGLLSVKDGSSTYHYTYDANGNVSEVLNSSGGVAAHYEYDAFGNTVASSGTYAAANAYRFSTKPMDSIVELYYYGLRYYNPSTGRWLNRDPIGEQGGVNLHAFVRNEPLGRVDFIGLLTITLNVSFSPQLTKEEKQNAHKELAKIKENLKACKQWGIDLDLNLSFVNQPGSTKGYPDFPKGDGNNLLFGPTKNLDGGTPGVTRGNSSIVDTSISKYLPGSNTASHEVAHQGNYTNNENPGPTLRPDGTLNPNRRDQSHSGDESSFMFPKGSSVEGYTDKVDKCWCEAMKRIAH